VRRAVLAAALGALAISACGRPPSPAAPKRPPPPPPPKAAEPPRPSPTPVENSKLPKDLPRLEGLDASLEFEFQIADLGDGRRAFRMTLPVANPNPHAAKIERVVYTLWLGRHSVLSSRMERSDRLRPQGFAILHIDYDAPGWQLTGDAVVNSAERPRLEGWIHAAAPDGPTQEFYFESLGFAR
jgi:hypothetical protein